MSSYTVTRRGGCVLVGGSIPAGDLIALMGIGGKGETLSPNLARLTKSTFAWGSAAAIAALTTSVLHETPVSADPLHEWIRSGEHGLSSLAIVNHLVPGAIPPHLEPTTDYPRDPSDFARCRKLLDSVPELVPLLPKMAELSSVWAGLVGNWHFLCGYMDEENPHWREGRGSNIKTYVRMREIIEGKTP
jgi:hypothetical protein